ncbi:hypothetical protein J8273_6477 [Carpediemonas membranifera]|uniref:Uncharacterized protein n=1 Tax=Carpediemonas membranifera TaxID=201153 RepID=A0A8J6BVS2_9EUKA|nr:hypothetical protein J8273_6477 [Carpediemonas membranifera]|eukprot:KAG9391701.1 hypothetical protein J8273_6477 [Carpediemonas membranifera]
MEVKSFLPVQRRNGDPEPLAATVVASGFVCYIYKDFVRLISLVSPSHFAVDLTRSDFQVFETNIDLIDVQIPDASGHIVAHVISKSGTALKYTFSNTRPPQAVQPASATPIPLEKDATATTLVVHDSTVLVGSSSGHLYGNDAHRPSYHRLVFVYKPSIGQMYARLKTWITADTTGPATAEELESGERVGPILSAAVSQAGDRLTLLTPTMLLEFKLSSKGKGPIAQLTSALDPLDAIAACMQGHRGKSARLAGMGPTRAGLMLYARITLSGRHTLVAAELVEGEITNALDLAAPNTSKVRVVAPNMHHELFVVTPGSVGPLEFPVDTRPRTSVPLAVLGSGAVASRVMLATGSALRPIPTTAVFIVGPDSIYYAVQADLMARRLTAGAPVAAAIATTDEGMTVQLNHMISAFSRGDTGFVSSTIDAILQNYTRQGTVDFESFGRVLVGLLDRNHTSEPTSDPRWAESAHSQTDPATAHMVTASWLHPRRDTAIGLIAMLRDECCSFVFDSLPAAVVQAIAERLAHVLSCSALLDALADTPNPTVVLRALEQTTLRPSQQFFGTIDALCMSPSTIPKALAVLCDATEALIESTDPDSVDYESLSSYLAAIDALVIGATKPFDEAGLAALLLSPTWSPRTSRGSWVYDATLFDSVCVVCDRALTVLERVAPEIDGFPAACSVSLESIVGLILGVGRHLSEVCGVISEEKYSLRRFGLIELFSRVAVGSPDVLKLALDAKEWRHLVTLIMFTHCARQGLEGLPVLDVGPVLVANEEAVANPPEIEQMIAQLDPEDFRAFLDELYRVYYEHGQTGRLLLQPTQYRPHLKNFLATLPDGERYLALLSLLACDPASAASHLSGGADPGEIRERALDGSVGAALALLAGAV